MRELQIGVVGLGNWGKNIARAFSRTSPAAELRWLCEENAKVLSAQRALYPHAQATNDLAEMLADPELDAVALATPAPSHYSLAKQVLLAKKHLFIEKPMTLVGEESAELVSLAESTGRTLMVGHLLEYHPAINWMKDYVASGALGNPHYVYTQRLNLGIVRSDENALWSLAPHDFSVILYLFGDEPDWVSAHGESYLQPGIEDVVFVYLHFRDGRSAQVHVSWLDPHKERRMVLVGSRTMVVFDDMQPMEPIRVYNKGAIAPEQAEGASGVTVRHGDVLIPHFAVGEPLALECRHFIDAVQQGFTPRSDGKDGWRVVRLLEAASASLRTQGQPVKVENDERATIFRA